MNLRQLVLAGIVCSTLTACGSAGQDKVEPDSSSEAQSVTATPSNEFTWTEDILYNATLESSIIDAWGYEDVNGESSIGVFAEATKWITDYYSSPKPKECAPILDLYVARTELDAEFYSVVDHYNQDPSNFTSFVLSTYAYPNEQKAIDHFTSAFTAAPICGNFEAIRKGNEIVKVGLWDEPKMLESNLIQGSKNITTNTYGRTGSTIWTLVVTDVNDPDKALEVSNQAIPVIQERLKSAQNLS